jgi:hypothetical protein
MVGDDDAGIGQGSAKCTLTGMPIAVRRCARSSASGGGAHPGSAGSPAGEGAQRQGQEHGGRAQGCNPASGAGATSGEGPGLSPCPEHGFAAFWAVAM